MKIQDNYNLRIVVFTFSPQYHLLDRPGLDHKQLFIQILLTLRHCLTLLYELLDYALDNTFTRF
jgi:hypothetical protein